MLTKIMSCNILVINIIIVIIADCLITRIYCSVHRLHDRRSADTIKKEVFDNTRISYKFIENIRLFVAGGMRLKLFILSYLPSHCIRKFMLKHIYLMDIKEDVVIYSGFEIRSPWNISIGRGSIIGDGVKLDGRGGITIGENVNLSTGVWVWTEQHDINDDTFKMNKKAPVRINNYAWLSARTTVLPGVVIEEGCVIAAGCVVTKDCEMYKIYGGVPGKIIGQRNNNLKYCFDGSHLSFL